MVSRINQQWQRFVAKLTVRRLGAILLLSALPGMVWASAVEVGAFRPLDILITLYNNFSWEVAATAFAVLFIDQMYQIQETKQQKQGLIRQLTSSDPRQAFDALAQLRTQGWLQSGDLHGADLHHARLAKANLHGASLVGVNLHLADLAAADLEEADLTDANLQAARRRSSQTGGGTHGAPRRVSTSTHRYGRFPPFPTACLSRRNRPRWASTQRSVRLPQPSLESKGVAFRNMAAISDSAGPTRPGCR